MLFFFTDEGGQGLAEYGVILALISVAAVVVLSLIGPKVLQLFTNANSVLP